MPQLQPQSNLYSYQDCVVDAASPRFPQSVVLPTPSNNYDDYQLKIVYRKYSPHLPSNTTTIPRKKINLVVTHSNGTNKGMWHYHIHKLYEFYNSQLSADSPAYLNQVLAIDSINHGQSAYLNRDKLGTKYHWFDSSKDVVKLIKDHELTTYTDPEAINIPVGFLMGGTILLYATFFEPHLFDSCIIINPILFNDLFMTKMVRKMLIEWDKQKIIRSRFDLKSPDSNWFDHIYQFYAKESFYKKFKPEVINNLIIDETTRPLSNPSSPEVDNNRSTFDINTPAVQQLVSFIGAIETMKTGMKVLPLINKPVYNFVSEFDSMSPTGLKFGDDALKKVLHKSIIPKTSHLFFGEKPQIVIDLITNTIAERLKLHGNRNQLYQDDVLSLNLGPDYRKQLFDHYWQDVILTAGTEQERELKQQQREKENKASSKL